MKQVTLSFDNGPDPAVTPCVLDVLARHDVKATFFLVGSRIAAGRKAAERARDEGHWTGNHTWSHSIPFRDRGDAAFVQAEIEDTQRELGALARPEKLFRPFGGQGRLDGALNGTVARHLQQGGYTCILWNAVPGDYRDFDGWVETALRQVAAQDRPLVVLHDINMPAMRHLDRFIGTLRDRGMVFVQDFPRDCVAIDHGRPTAVLETDVLSRSPAG